MDHETRQQLNKIRFALGEVAARDSNDIIANSASALCVRLETVGNTFGIKLTDLTDVDRQLIRYALAEQDQKKAIANITS